MKIDRIYPILVYEVPQAPQCKRQRKEKSQQPFDVRVLQRPESQSDVSIGGTVFDNGLHRGPVVLYQHRVELSRRVEFLNQVPDDLIYPTGRID